MFISNGLSNFSCLIERKFPQKNGYILAFIGQLLISFSVVQIKQLKQFSGIDIAFNRGIILFFLNYPQIQKSENIIVHPKENKINSVLLLRTVTTAFQVIFYFTGLTLINLGNAQVLANTTPIWSVLLYVFILRQKIERAKIILIISAFCGMLMIFQSNFTESLDYNFKFLIGNLFCLISAILYSFVTYTNQILKEKVTVPILLHYFYFGTLVVISFVNVVRGQACKMMNNYQAFEIFQLFSIALLSYASQVFMNKALCIKLPYQILPFMYISIVIAFLFDWFLFKQDISVISLLGAIVIVVSCYLLQQKK